MRSKMSTSKIRSRNIKTNNLKYFLIGLIPMIVVLAGIFCYWAFVQKDKDYATGYDAGIAYYKNSMDFQKVPVAAGEVKRGESLKNKIKYIELPKESAPDRLISAITEDDVARINIPANMPVTAEMVMDRNEALFDDTRGDWLLDVKTFDIEVGNYVDIKYLNAVTDQVVLSKKRILKVNGSSIQVLMDEVDRIYFNDARQRVEKEGGELIVSLYPDPRVQNAADRDYALQFSKSIEALKTLENDNTRENYGYLIEQATPEDVQTEEPSVMGTLSDVLSPADEDVDVHEDVTKESQGEDNE